MYGYVYIQLIANGGRDNRFSHVPNNDGHIQRLEAKISGMTCNSLSASFLPSLSVSLHISKQVSFAALSLIKYIGHTSSLASPWHRSSLRHRSELGVYAQLPHLQYRRQMIKCALETSKLELKWKVRNLDDSRNNRELMAQNDIVECS